MSVGDQGATFAEFIRQQHAAELARVDRFNRAAATIVTGSAAFVALIVAVAALSLGRDFQLPDGADISDWVRAAQTTALSSIVLFALSGGYAWHVQQIRQVQVATVDALRVMVGDGWTTTEVGARNIASKHLVNEIDSMREANNSRAVSLKKASAFQVAAFVFFTLTILFAFAGT